LRRKKSRHFWPQGADTTGMDQGGEMTKISVVFVGDGKQTQHLDQSIPVRAPLDRELKPHSTLASC
jgi:hypothetical protein